MDFIDISTEEEQFTTEIVPQISGLKWFNGDPSIEYQRPTLLDQINPECQETLQFSDSEISVGYDFPAPRGFPEEWLNNTLFKDRELDILNEENNPIVTIDSEFSPWSTLSVDSGYISDIPTLKRRPVTSYPKKLIRC